MKKILDNSAVSSLGKEITSIDALGIVSSEYEILLTNSVLRECKNLGDNALFNRVSKYPLAVKEDLRFKNLTEAIGRINFRLGPGEINTIAASIILSSQNIDNYVVIDESLARKIVKTIHTNPNITEIMGCKISPVNCTGTIGIVAHLRDKGILSKEMTQKIAYDLEVSNFRVTDDLLNILR